MQLYPGNGSISAPTLLAGYGIWPTPNAVTGGDLRNAANLMAAVQSATDRTNTLAQRVLVRLNVIDGSTSTFTSTVKTRNKWQFDGHVEFIVGPAADVKSFVPFYIVGASTLHVGDATLGSGQIEVMRGSGIRLDGTIGSSGLARMVVTGTNADVQVLSGAAIAFDSGSFFNGYGTNRLGDSGGGGSTVQRHPYVQTGIHARREYRVRYLEAADFVYEPGILGYACRVNASEADLWILPNDLATLSPLPGSSGSYASIVQLIFNDESTPFGFTVSTSGNPDFPVQIESAQKVGRMGRFLAVSGTNGALANIEYHRGNGTLFVKNYFDITPGQLDMTL